jgi:pimeloyl-ACP methyl ester carboxylesterase
MNDDPTAVIEKTTPRDSNLEAEIVDVLIFIHGIRTHAFWYDEARPILASIKRVEVRPVGYGYFNLLRFLFPFMTRLRAQRTVLKKIRDIKWDFEKRGQKIRLSVIAHSFGTYTILSILNRENDIDLHNLILCGSVVPSDFDFGEISRKVHNHCINDAGSKDIWPIFARLSSFVYGQSGTFGFQSGLCTDRFHNFTHSDFFNAQFIKDFWYPIFAQNKVVPTEFRRTFDSWTRTLSFLSVLPKGTLPIILIVAVAFAAYLSPFRVEGWECLSWLHSSNCIRSTDQCDPKQPFEQCLPNLQRGGQQ